MKLSVALHGADLRTLLRFEAALLNDLNLVRSLIKGAEREQKRVEQRADHRARLLTLAQMIADKKESGMKRDAIFMALSRETGQHRTVLDAAWSLYGDQLKAERVARRNREVVEMYKAGHSNAEIAAAMAERYATLRHPKSVSRVLGQWRKKNGRK